MLRRLLGMSDRQLVKAVRERDELHAEVHRLTEDLGRAPTLPDDAGFRVVKDAPFCSPDKS